MHDLGMKCAIRAGSCQRLVSVLITHLWNALDAGVCFRTALIWLPSKPSEYNLDHSECE